MTIALLADGSTREGVCWIAFVSIPPNRGERAMSKLPSTWYGGALLMGFALAACERTDPVDDAPAGQPAEELAPPAAGVERTPPAPPVEPAAAAASETAIQTQEGSPGHIQVDLTRAQVTGDVLLVQLRFRNTSQDRFTTVRFPVDEVSYIDDSSARRYGVLEDEANTPMASPLSEDEIVLRVAHDESAVAWFGFAAPDPQSETVSINIPGVGPFDATPVSR
jgi:hypothetical protein